MLNRRRNQQSELKYIIKFKTSTLALLFYHYLLNNNEFLKFTADTK